MKAEKAGGDSQLEAPLGTPNAKKHVRKLKEEEEKEEEQELKLSKKRNALTHEFST